MQASRQRVFITAVSPQIDCADFPIKRCTGDCVVVEADIFSDGHDAVSANLLFRKASEQKWRSCQMRLLDNDRFTAGFVVEELGTYHYTIQAWVDKKWVTQYGKILSVTVEPILARFSAWYELFPRSFGGIRGCIPLVKEIASMGFDTLYLPPIHPIGASFRKGKNNALKAQDDDVGSPWAIGSNEGGHMSIHKELGSFEDFAALVKEAKEYKIAIALDLAFQCSPDHPYITEHPEWFSYLPDGTIKHAENPPKKYEDIVPFNFETDEIDALWNELLQVVLFWVEKQVKVFRVDNPHTKPFLFWKWLIAKVKESHPEVIFLSEAFTRPKVMYTLAKLGFSQSYTYFTWRYSKKELVRYMSEITRREVLDYFRPNLWPNTPDILPIDLQYFGKVAFMTRLILAATLSSNYGVYGPAFQAIVNESSGDSEEYKDAEKYEKKTWDISTSNEIKELMQKLNKIRRENPALQVTDNLVFHETQNPNIICYSKAADDLLLIVVSLDPLRPQSTQIQIPNAPHTSYRVHELLHDRKHIWEGNCIEVQIDPNTLPAQIFRFLTPIKREKGFAYYM